MRYYLAISRGRPHRLSARPGPLFIGCIGVLLLVTNGLSQESSGQLPSQEVPKAATIEIVLLTGPGVNDEGSKWEIAYEFRITNEAANEAAFFEARKQGKPQGTEARVGELIKAGDVKQLLRSAENHKFVLQIPFGPEIQERLRNQPREHAKIAPGPRTPEINMLLQEQEIKFQVFMFYSVINIYDARLKKNIIIPVPQEWSFATYPDARFGFKIEINSDVSYRWTTSLPANTRKAGGGEVISSEKQMIRL